MRAPLDIIRWRGLAAAFALAVIVAPAGALAQTAGGANAPATNGAAATVPDTTVQKAGLALRKVTQLRQSYGERIRTAAPAQQQSLAKEARTSAVKAVQDEGLTIDQYNSVIRLAQADPDLRRRLISAAQGAR